MQVLMLGLFLGTVTLCLAAPQRFDDIRGRIINGIEVDISEVPYQVAVLFQDHQVCGGVLISPTVVLTALHCWLPPETNQNISEYSVRVGSTYWEKGGQQIFADSVVYNIPKGETSLENDVAIIKLKSQVSVPNAIPIVLDDVDTVHEDGELVTLSGWGATQFPLNASAPVDFPLKEVNLTVTACDEGSSNKFICFAQNGSGPCYGDSGGPAVINGKLVGLAYSTVCGSNIYSAYYTRIAAFRGWIRDETGI
ncbi:trypsin-3-like [Cylas formicarius]|uniref:trypsin-3-like n=1 Tax=Cylas formicarius TaxID=197179 RepID=UPI002958BB40|nr:trypsin-3-like [Cylas formicarius]